MLKLTFILAFFLFLAIRATFAAPADRAAAKADKYPQARDYAIYKKGYEKVKDVPSLPRVLLIGDSLSEGYTYPTRLALAGKANLHRAPTNARYTARGLRLLKGWLGGKKWDVIHFNFGLHDINHNFKVNGVSRNHDRPQTLPEDYERNLRKFILRLRDTGAKLIWASSTPVPPGPKGSTRRNADAIRYNRIAAKVMQDNGIPVNDLYTLAHKKLSKSQRKGPRDVHFNDEGYRVLGKQTAACILRTLKAPAVGLGLSPDERTARLKLYDEGFVKVRDTSPLPRVLLIGDSISVYYTKETRRLLRGKANVHRIGVNGKHTRVGLAGLDKWLGRKKWDVIHFNWGLHDLAWDGENNRVPPREYGKNLRELVRRLKATGATLIWCSTTPVPKGPTNRRTGDAVKYNRIAEKVMKENRVTINDLYAFALPQLNRIQIWENVHFTVDGSAVLAEPVAAAIDKVLKRKARPGR